jgi:hypothetical protein
MNELFGSLCVKLKQTSYIHLKRILITLVVVTGSVLTFSQPDVSDTHFKYFKLGAGAAGYMNNLFIPAGMTGINLSSAYQIRYITAKEKDRIKIDNINLRFDYSRLLNRQGEESLRHPTDLYNINVYAERLFQVYSGESALSIFAGPDAGLNAGLCINNYYAFESDYYTPVYNEWNIFLGFSFLMNLKLKRFTLENKVNIPCFLVGRWPEYGKSQESRSLADHIRAVEFNNLSDYLNLENSLTLYYSGSKPLKIFLSYSLIRHSSDIDRVIQKYTKNTVCIGFIINKL